LVIEAEETIGNGVTEEDRHGFARVGPIRLVEPSGQLPAAEAAEALKLDSGRPAVLLQLGAGESFDVVDALNHIVHRIEATGVQIAVLESPGGVSAVFLPPAVRRLRGFPIGRYYKAFDFSIAVPGYSVFNEAMALGLPSIFVLTDESRTDEAQRAKRAQDAGAALMVSLKDLKDIGAMAHVLLSEQARTFLSKNCAKMSRPNGAPEAARAIVEAAWRWSAAERSVNGRRS
jgi:UDP:flavonoid glycosyltransferase YjiC (YdhE family)